MQTQNESSPVDIKKLLFTILKRFILGYIVLGLIFFVPAGSLRFTEAWIYILTLLLPMTFVLIYFFKKDPKVLERRMKIHEKEKEERLLIKLGWIFFIIAFLIPGFDFRYDWSYVPFSVVIIADAFVLIGYMIFFFVMKTNAYAARTVEVEKEQRVISEGLYSVVRHPMYIGAIIMYFATPIVLGSWWALLALSPLLVILIYRILNEEKVLLRDLPGYSEYMCKVRYRLIPHIW